MDLMGLMGKQEADFTNTFRGLSEGSARDQFVDREDFNAWSEIWEKRLESEDNPLDLMRSVNPSVIPRNHRIAAMISAAVQGDYAPFHTLQKALATPYEAPQVFPDLTHPPKDEERVTATFCGT